MMAMTTSNSIIVKAERRGIAIPSRTRWTLRVLNGLVLVLLLMGCQKSAPTAGKSAAELEEMLKSKDPVVQSQAALGLSQLGEKAAPAVPALAEALKSS